MREQYLAYGLHLNSDGPLPGLVRVESFHPAGAEVNVYQQVRPKQFEEAPREEIWFVSEETDDGGRPDLVVSKVNGGSFFRMLYCDGLEFIVDAQGTRLWATRPSQTPIEDMATCLAGPVLGFLLRLRGIVCLHASAVTVNGRAAVFMGPAGSGKSTIAATLALAGFPVLADDLVALSPRDDQIEVLPGLPRIRLWPEVGKSLLGASGELPRLTPTWEKRYLDVSQNGCQFCSDPVPLGLIYTLSASRNKNGLYVSQVTPPSSKLIGLVTHTYSNYLLSRRMRRDEFQKLGKVVEAVPVRRLTRPRKPGCVSNLLQTITEDMSSLNQ